MIDDIISITGNFTELPWLPEILVCALLFSGVLVLFNFFFSLFGRLFSL